MEVQVWIRGPKKPVKKRMNASEEFLLSLKSAAARKNLDLVIEEFRPRSTSLARRPIVSQPPASYIRAELKTSR